MKGCQLQMDELMPDKEFIMNQQQSSIHNISTIKRIALLQLAKDYYMSPTADEILIKNMRAYNLTIRYRNTSVTWPGLINLETLQYPLKQIIFLGQKFIQVYPDDKIKPQEGSELNRPAIVTFRPTQIIKVEQLQLICHKNDIQLSLVDITKNQFKVSVMHFTKWDFNKMNEQSEEQEQNIYPNNRSIGNRSNLLEENKMNFSGQNGGFSQTGHLMQLQPMSEEKEQQIETNLSYDQENEVRIVSFNENRQKYQVQCPYIPQKYKINDNQCIESEQLLMGLLSKNAKKFKQQLTKRNRNQNTDNTNYNKIKRVFTLDEICNSQSHSINKIKSNIDPNQKDKLQSLKNWFQQVCHIEGLIDFDQQADQNLEQNIHKSLISRNRQSSLLKLRYFENSSDIIELLCCIQDPLYRYGTSISQMFLNDDLKSLFNGIVTFNLHKNNWILHMALSLWYCFIPMKQNIKAILAYHLDNFNYSLQYLILSRYNNPISCQVIINCNTVLDITLLWYFENQNSSQLRNNTQYKLYRIRLLKKLLSVLTDIEVIMRVICFDKIVQQKQKMFIMKNIIGQKFQQGILNSQVLCQRNQYNQQICKYTQNLLLEYDGYQQRNKGQYLQALKLWLKIEGNLSQKIKYSFIQICFISNVICNNNRIFKYKLKKILQKAKVIQFQLNSILNALILYLKLDLDQHHIQDINKQHFLKLCQLINGKKLKIQKNDYNSYYFNNLYFNQEDCTYILNRIKEKLITNLSLKKQIKQQRWNKKQLFQLLRAYKQQKLENVPTIINKLPSNFLSTILMQMYGYQQSIIRQIIILKLQS